MNNSVTIEVEVSLNGKLLNPIKFDDTEISELGLYEISGQKIWVVKKQSKRIELPETVLPRSADHRENIIELCKAVNTIIGYLRQREQEDTP